MQLSVRKAMVKGAVFLGRDASAMDAARQISEHKIGCVIITGPAGDVVGIVTEKDLVRKVMAQNRPAESVKVGDIMSSPVITIDPDSDISEAAKKMAESDVRRLPVMEKGGKLVGIITDKDIIRVEPEMVEILREFLSLRGGAQAGQVPRRLKGMCELCDNFSDELVEISGRLMCPECREDVASKGEETLGEDES